MKSNDSTPSTETPDLSVVVPVFNEASNIVPLLDRLKEVLDQKGVSWEVLFADDGSSDHTWEILETCHQNDPRIKAISLSRNFGHQYALYAGLSLARGQAVVMMDGDLQHPPGVIPNLLEEWRKGFKIVHTVRRDSPETSFWKRTTSRFFYRVFSLLTGVKLTPGMADFRLLDRQAVDAILGFRENGLFIRGIVQWVGYPSTVVGFDCGSRFSGTSTYSLKRMLKLASTGLTSFSTIPLRIGIFVGLLTSLLAFSELVYAVYVKLVLGEAVPGWASAVSIVSFLFGILFILLGLLGEYISRILVEARDRPRFLVNEKIGLD